MGQPPVVIKLTPAQRALVYEASGKNVLTLGIEPVETGSGWLYCANGKKFWLLKHPDTKSYEAARRNHRPWIDPQRARFRLRIGASCIHRWGVFAEEPIPARRNVIEYVGELVNPVECHQRTKNAKEMYAIGLDDIWTIDGAIGGSGAEFINHSCDPNIRYRKWQGRVFCQSIRSIEVGEELTADYHFSHKAPILPCRCGSPKCRGTMNAPKSSDQILEWKRRWKSNGRKQTDDQVDRRAAE